MKGKQNRLSLPIKEALVLATTTAVVFLGLVGITTWQFVQYKMNQGLLQAKDAVIIEQQTFIDSLSILEKGEKQTLMAERDALTQTVLTQTQKLESQRQDIDQLQLQSSYQRKQLKRKDQSIQDLRRAYQRELDASIADQQRIIAAEQAGLVIVRDQLKLESARLQQQEAQVMARIGDVEEWEKKKQEFEIRYASEAKEAIHVTRVDDLMSQFNGLQVDLDVMNECDKAYLYRYNEAKSILNHIRTYIQSNKMKDDYYFYVISNDSHITAQNRNLCLES